MFENNQNPVVQPPFQQILPTNNQNFNQSEQFGQFTSNTQDSQNFISFEDNNLSINFDCQKVFLIFYNII